LKFYDINFIMYLCQKESYGRTKASKG